MAQKKYKPTTNGRRHMTGDDFSDLTTRSPEKSLLRPLKKSGGRNNFGHTTSKHRGGGHKRRYRMIDWRRNDKDGMAATVQSIEYDPNRSARIALLEYEDGERRYIIAPVGLDAGDEVVADERTEPRTGNCMCLKYVPLGLQVHNVELRPGGGGEIVRSAGSSAQVSAREGRYVHLILPSGEVRRVLGNCRATLGRVSNIEHEAENAGKAGKSRWKGRRPHTRGKAMNPVSHPLGGGEAQSNGGRHPVSRTGVPAKGGKTRKGKKHSDRLIVSRRK